MTQMTTKQATQEWYDFHKAFNSGLILDLTETNAQKIKRIKLLEQDPEAWFLYYFVKFCKATPTTFQTAATRRVMENAEWYEVRAWSRELAKTARTMMEVCYLVMTGRKRTVMLTSNSQDNAERLLAPYRAFFECNALLINDYGPQVNLGNWTSSEFSIRAGAAFRAVGARQSPRGSRNEEMRPDVILVDDYDTDEECRNPDILTKKWDWFEKALYPTRSISLPLLVIFCGNIIAVDCCIKRAIAMADHSDIINIRDENGKSTWPSKNTEEAIDRSLSKISYKAQQGEYFNNPVQEGSTFAELTFGVVPPLEKFDFVVAYADPATSNSDKKTSCTKALVLTGAIGARFYVIKCFVDNATTDTFVQWFFDLQEWIAQRVTTYFYIENNSLQDPFYSQVFIPAFAGKARKLKTQLGITPDTRVKKDKFTRLEACLEPLVRLGDVVFNIDQQGNPHMMRLQEQFRLFGPRLSAPCDGVDALEGGIFIVKSKRTLGSQAITYIHRKRNSKRI